MEIVSYNEGEILISEGAVADRMIVLLEGELQGRRASTAPATGASS